MAAFTSKANGNWATSGQTTWNEAGVPGSGDTVTITHNVTVTADTIVGIGTATTALTVNTTGGTLTVTGAKLTIKGNATLGAYNGGTVRDVLVLNPSGATQGGIEFDANSGVTPVVTTDFDTRIVANGTNSGHCYIRTKSGSAGGNASFTNAGNDRSSYWLATYTDFARLGTTGTAGITSSCNGGAAFATNPTHFTLSFDHCVFDACGAIPYAVGGTDGTGIWSFTSCLWQNSLEDGSSNDNGCLYLNYAGFAIAGIGVRLIDNCVFLNTPFFTGPRDFTIANCYFGDVFHAAATLPWLSCDGCFIQSTLPAIRAVMGSLSNCYLYAYGTPGTSNMMHIGHYGNNTDDGANGQGGNFIGNVAEWAGSASIQLFTTTEGDPPTTDRTFVFKNNVVFSSGTGSMLFFEANSNIVQPFRNVDTIEHNTVILKAQNAVEGATTVGIQAGSMASLKANIFYNTGSSTGVYVFQNTDTAPVTDALAASAVKANCWKAFAASPAGQFSGVSGDTGVEDGTVYSSPMSGATAPGAGDLANTDPAFADTTRNLATWDASLGGAGTVAAARLRLQADLTLVKSSLLPYVRAGYRPTNTALRGASYAGDSLTTDAAGNAWAGGATPDIGAMAWAASDAMLAVETGMFSLSSNAVNLLAGHALPIATGSFAFMGNDAGLLAGRALAMPAGVYAVTGRAVDLRWSGSILSSYVGPDEITLITP